MRVVTFHFTLYNNKIHSSIGTRLVGKGIKIDHIGILSFKSLFMTPIKA